MTTVSAYPAHPPPHAASLSISIDASARRFVPDCQRQARPRKKHRSLGPRRFPSLAQTVVAAALALDAGSGGATAQTRNETRYLLFQIFTGAPDPRIPLGDKPAVDLPAPSKSAVRDLIVQDVVARIGTVGTLRSKLGFSIGPLALDHPDDELRRLVREAFEIAVETNVAVAFHIDDSMFYGRRVSLRDPSNYEWIDWSGTVSTGREIDWGSRRRLPPQLCFNCPRVIAEVRRVGRDVIGAEIKKGIDGLASQGKPDLFAGVIAGWETQMGKDFDSEKPTGFHALSNRGFSAKHPPASPDGEREDVVREFIEVWSQALVDAGIPVTKVYSHVWTVSARMYEEATAGRPRDRVPSMSQLSNFSPMSIASGSTHRPGFSIYPASGVFDDLYAELARQGHPPWACAEGTNIRPGRGVGSSRMTMETYLAKMYNHGAVLVNIFSWGIGGDEFKNSDFRIVTEGAEALAAYRKLLRDEPLIEANALLPDPEPGLPWPLFAIAGLLTAIVWMVRRRLKHRGQLAE